MIRIFQCNGQLNSLLCEIYMIIHGHFAIYTGLDLGLIPTIKMKSLIIVVFPNKVSLYSPPLPVSASSFVSTRARLNWKGIIKVFFLYSCILYMVWSNASFDF
ncbi:hypothetical protein L2E82_14726 [Cichorium intybus]|uniref:Uncharacterized protein n=1 Tax=Cichorium intybus TaxID=13427 RepID=A0ACB9F1E3_CICIN|nr:hypothetical protein L2E82_14726 [Cichorium intybus]